jgi:hypothetical protein
MARMRPQVGGWVGMVGVVAGMRPQVGGWVGMVGVVAAPRVARREPLDARGFAVSEEQRERIEHEGSLETFARWLRRAVTAGSVVEALEG